MKQSRYHTRLESIPQLNTKEIDNLKPVVQKYMFRVSEYYLGLINWNDPNDPIRRVVIPDIFELQACGELDASNEEDFTVAPGTQHKYRDTAVLLVNDVCGAYCRFCFRKRLFMNDNDEVVRDVSEGLKYIAEHPDINNVLLTGGDPLLMSTRELENIMRQIRAIDHVRIIRIGTKMLSFNPFRILNDPALLEALARYSSRQRKIYIMAHFNHPRELTEEALAAAELLHKAGVIMVNQTPLIRGVNDDPLVLSSLCNQLSFAGIPPYYLFQCRPTAGNFTYSVPIERGLDIFRRSKLHCSGLAKRARYTMSHHTGKIEIVGMTNNHTFLKYHRAADRRLIGKFIAVSRNPNAYWLDDYEEIQAGSEYLRVLQDQVFN